MGIFPEGPPVIQLNSVIRDRNRTQKAKTELSLTIWLFRWETLYHWFLFFQSLKCNSPKTVVHKKAKSNRAICLFRRKPLSHGCLCTLSIWNLIPLSEGHTFFLLCGLCYEFGVECKQYQTGDNYRPWFSSPVFSGIVWTIYIAITSRSHKVFEGLYSVLDKKKIKN